MIIPTGQILLRIVLKENKGVAIKSFYFIFAMLPEPLLNNGNCHLDMGISMGKSNYY